MVAWVQDRGRRSGTSLLTNRRLTNRRFPSEGPAPPNCRCGSISVLRLNNPHSAVELLRHASVPQDRYLFRTTSRLSPSGRAEDCRERETNEIRRRSGGSGPPLRTALQNSKLPGMFPESVGGRLDESQPAIPSPKLALQIG